MLGETEVTRGHASSYVKPEMRPPTAPEGVDTSTPTVPTVPGGVVAVIRFGLTTVTEVPGTPPKVTVAGATNPAPLIETTVPPAEDPTVGETLLTVGWLPVVVVVAPPYERPGNTPDCPPGLETITDTAPIGPAGAIAVMRFDATTWTLVAE